MLRRGLAFLVMSALCVSTAAAADSKPARTTTSQSGGLLGWIRTRTSHSGNTARTHKPSPVHRAVVNDAERQAAHVRQTAQGSDEPEATNSATANFVEVAPPVPIVLPPAVPNTDPTSGPQYFSSTAGNGFSNPVPVTPGANWQPYEAPQPLQATSAAPLRPLSSSVPRHLMTSPVAYSQSPAGTAAAPSPTPIIGGQGMYPQTGAALYPAPIPGIPQQVGGTMIANPALHPHEMLYAHRYKAMYPPYYYKVNGGWVVSPFGVWSHENWKLQGTTVDVKYHSHISPFALFKPPGSR